MPSPLIAITMGDPAGIGPEIIVKALGERKVFAQCRPVVLGDEVILSYTTRWLKASVTIKRIEGPEQGVFKPGILNLIPLTDLSPEEVPVGTPQQKGGEAAYRYIERGVELAQAGVVDALVTAPISKEALNAAGHPFPGHTELLAKMTGSKGQVMMLAGPTLRVALVTTHLPLRAVPAFLSRERIKRTIETTSQWLKDYWGIKFPRLAVTGLNPHAGEGGLFGSEEQEVIAPAIEGCRQGGITVDGPLPADSLFFHAASGKYDAVVAMYHDQGLIPLKLLHFRDGVNITLGLPIIRTSVDHGTGYDIAGQGVADPTSLINAILMAANMAMTKMSQLKRG
ncbi:MAG: 4-hydroxythreonine-4-phosphate dehydrogenase PdxA [Deltaproteobacteria bacterium RBG_13_52_11]|nr:MAG: 4-hydroxythreonine-4-phosphate dehydrogenase PdxA [Deltaproteobacteria bacterium RBG_13_52_11]